MKKTVLTILIDLVFVVVFNVVFFVMGGFDRTSSEWIAYAFVHLSYLFIIITPLLTTKGISSHVFGMSLYTISGVYFYVTLVSAILFIGLKQESYKACLITNVIITGFYLICLFTMIIINDDTSQKENNHQNELQYVKICSAKLNSLSAVVENQEVKKKMEQAYDIIHSSQTKTTPIGQQYEARIYGLIESLDVPLRNGDNEGLLKIMDSIIISANERNEAVKH